MEKDTFASKPKARCRALRVVLIILFALFTWYTLTDLFSNEQNVGHFVSTEGKREYLEAYDEVMGTISAPTTIYDTSTSWGTVRVYEWANEEYHDAPPVVLLPGYSSGAPMWQSNIAGFSERHTVYAIDALGDAGRSLQSVPLKDMKDVTGWMSETLDGLGIGRAHIIGHSFGGGYAANFAQNYPEHVQTLTLLEPAFALNFPSFSVLFGATVGSMEFLPESWRNEGLALITGEAPSDIASDDPMARMITAANTYYSASLPTPETLTAEELATKLGMPIYIALAENSPITGEKAAENAKLIPQATVKVWANTTHSLPMEVADELASVLNQFWRENE